MTLPLLLLTAALLAQSPDVDQSLRRPILAPEQARVDTQVWTASEVPVLHVPPAREASESYARTLRLSSISSRASARESTSGKNTIEHGRLALGGK